MLTACQNVDFRGNSGAGGQKGVGDDALGDKSRVDQRGKDGSWWTPEAPTLNDEGWIGDQTRSDFAELFPPGGNPDDSGETANPDIGTNGEGSGGPFDGTEAVYWLPCSKDSPNRDKGEFHGPSSSRVRMAGELCPKRPSAEKLTVLFVVDFSGSMEGSPFEGPNDPTTGSSCGRLKAAEAVLKQYAADEFDGVKVKAGMVSFSNDAAIKIPIGTVASMKSGLSTAIWCGADGATAKTNYRAAFEQARAALSDVDGHKVIYFISDGSPTVGGGSGQTNEAAGVEAAEALREGVDDLTINAVFLGYKNGTANDPRGYLEQITGDAKTVAVAASADDLVEAIESIDSPIVRIKQQDVAATLSAPGASSKPLKIDTVRRHPKNPKRWVWYSAPFALHGKEGEPVVNTVAVEAETSTGEQLESTARITYVQEKGTSLTSAD